MKNQTSVAGSPQKGFGLLETLLALGAVSVLSLGIYMVLKPASATAQVSVESDNLTQLASSIDRSFGLVGGFDGVSASRVVIDGLAPDKMTKGTALRTQWGAPVSVASTSIKAPNDGFTVTYPNTPADVCSSLAAAVYRQTYDIRIGGTSVVSDGSFNPAATASACNGNGVTMEFVYHSGLVAGTAVAAPPLVLPDTPVAVLPPDSAPIGDAVDPVDGVGGAAPLTPVESNPVAAPPPVPPALPPAVAPVSPTTPPVTPVAPPVTPPTASVAACSVPANTVENQNVYCPAGQYGLINQSRFATWSCPEAWDAPVQGPFSAWTNAGGSCATCPDGSEQTQSQWVVASAPCPSGQVGSNTWEKEQRQTRSVTYSCPAGTTSLPSPNIGGWSAWVDTGATRNASNTCTTPASGVCPTRRLELGCAVYDIYTGARVTGVELGDYIGFAFDSGQSVRCEFGYGDAFTPEGFPAPLQGTDVQLLYVVRGADQWEYSLPEDASSYMTVYARNADGSRGAQCWGESKTMYNYEGK